MKVLVINNLVVNMDNVLALKIISKETVGYSDEFGRLRITEVGGKYFDIALNEFQENLNSQTLLRMIIDI
jgi:hypothetical protein